MIQDYFPNLLVEARGKAILLHPHSVEGYRPLSGEELESLLTQLLNCKDAYLSEFAESLTSRQLEGLADYYCHTDEPKEETKIEFVLRERMTPRLLKKLYTGWQERPEIKSLFSTFIVNDVLENRPEEIIPSHETLLRWKSIWDSGLEYYGAVNTDCVISHIVPNKPFSMAWKEADFRSGTKLYIQCFANYLAECSIQALKVEADEDLQTELQALNKGPVKESVLDNLLTKADSSKDWIVELRRTYLEAYNYYGIPERNRFSNDVSYSVYQWWYNYMELDQGFLESDRRRLRFWMRYIDRCRVTRIRASGFLIMEFDQVIAVESEEIGRLYFFEKEYFKVQVRYRLLTYSEARAKSWLWNYSQRYACITHYSSWQADATRALSKFANI